MSVVVKNIVSIEDVDDIRSEPIVVETESGSDEVVVRWEGQNIYMYRDEVIAFAGALLAAAERVGVA